ncbi:MAG: anthrone oxygenase family protein [Planctomycetota bacterium]|jgi:uncharacterized membrane protein
MELLPLALIVTALLCGLVAGLVLCFAVVVMPGIRRMGTHGFLASFKAMDRIIQDNQPLFMLTWVGSALAMLGTTILGVPRLEGTDQWLLIAACVAYLGAVHVPTVAINIPLNNRLQAADLEAMGEAELEELAALFATRWVRWNAIRTAVATAVTAGLLVLLTRV